MKSINLHVAFCGNKPVPGQGILVLVINKLCLIVDEQENNHGTSATNAMEEIIDYLESHGITKDGFDYVELDSIGFFDEVKVYERWAHGVRISHAPLRAGNQARTVGAFKAKYGEDATQLIDALDGRPLVMKTTPEID